MVTQRPSKSTAKQSSRPAAQRSAPKRASLAVKHAPAAAKQAPAAAKPKPARAPRSAKAPGGRDVPQLFRLNVEVGDLDAAERFYTRLLGVEGRRFPGARLYVPAGAVTLQVVDVSPSRKPHPNAESLTFLVRDLDAVYERAKALGCLSKDKVHGQPAGEIRARPWGERSFYAHDRWKNPLCFVQAGTTYAG